MYIAFADVNAISGESNNGFCVLQQAKTCKFTTTEEQETYEAQTTSRDVIKPLKIAYF